MGTRYHWVGGNNTKYIATEFMMLEGELGLGVGNSRSPLLHLMKPCKLRVPTIPLHYVQHARLMYQGHGPGCRGGLYLEITLHVHV